MKISVIVPVGNMDEWKVCEESILASIAAYSGKMEHELLPCFDLEHRGAYIARNEGLSKATGDWIAWVDCDDVVEPNWFTVIADTLEVNNKCDVLVFGINEVRLGKKRMLYSPNEHIEDGSSYARSMLNGLGMPHWLWHRVFKSELWKGVVFAGRVKQDYQASLQVLPKVKCVKFIPDCLYCYVKHGHGLSNYIQRMDYDEACKGFLGLINKLPEEWRDEARQGMALMLTDVILHDRSALGANKYLRPYFWRILVLRGMSLRFRIKSLLACLFWWR